VSTFRYYNASVAFGTKQINWLTDNIGALLVGAAYSPSQAHDQFVSDIPSQAIIARSGQMTSMAIVNGVCQGLIPQFGSLVATQPVTALVLYQNTTLDSSSRLIYFSDEGFGFPFLPQGLNYFVTYDQANGGWFEL
jgi:hypothetical protein